MKATKLNISDVIFISNLCLYAPMHIHLRLNRSDMMLTKFTMKQRGINMSMNIKQP